MKTVGIRELKQNASAVIRRVALGESFDVTDRGRPVAHIAPLSKGDHISRMIESGRMTGIEGDILNIVPVKIPPGKPPLSELLKELRHDER